MRDYTQDFSLMPGHTWLNVASEGPLPKCAVAALQEAIEWKNSPHLLTNAKFQQVPHQLKKTIAALVHADAEDVILGNSATYGIHILSHGLPFAPKDEIILLENDFPTDILPWLSLESKGVVVRQQKAKHHVFSPDEMEGAIGPQTKLVCLPYVHSFTGFKHDIRAIGRLCRSKNVLLMVNLSQAAGALEVDLNSWLVDAAVCAGYKWLLGPYGTGFCWIKKEVREKLDYPHNYWTSLMDGASLSAEGAIHLKDDHSARRYDVFGTANFFNYVPWQASMEYLLGLGIGLVSEHNSRLVDRFVDALDQKHFKLISPTDKKERTNLVVFSHQEPSQNIQLLDFLKTQGFYLALWKNKLRVSPHVYNTLEEMDSLLKTLAQYVSKGL